MSGIPRVPRRTPAHQMAGRATRAYSASLINRVLTTALNFRDLRPFPGDLAGRCEGVSGWLADPFPLFGGGAAGGSLAVSAAGREGNDRGVEAGEWGVFAGGAPPQCGQQVSAVTAARARTARL